MSKYPAEAPDETGIPNEGTVIVAPIGLRVRVAPYDDRAKRKQVGFDAQDTHVYTGRKTLNLADSYDRREYAFLKDHPMVVEMGKLSLMFIQETQKETVAQRNVLRDVLNRIEKMDAATKKHLLMVLVPDEGAASMDDLTVDARLSDMAIKTPAFLLAAIKDPGFAKKAIFFRGLACNAIEQRNGAFAIFNGGQLIGSSPEQAIAWFENNATAYASLVIEIEKREKSK